MSKKSYKTRKRILGLIVGFCLLITGFTPTTIMAYSAHTQSEAVACAQSQLGKALDYDGKYGAQCVDLICYYYQYLGCLLYTSDTGNLDIEIWERGSGYTKASGTGSCAAAVAAHRLGLVENRVKVNQPGGMIQIDIKDDGTIYMLSRIHI